jgi:hypothetical protein
MGKEEKERKPRKVRDIESEYPKWPWVDYKFQDAKFSEEVRKLLASGSDPKGEIIDKYVTFANIVGIFCNIHKFKIMNLLLTTEEAIGKTLLENLWHWSYHK